jgi:hypothetical protein
MPDDDETEAENRPLAGPDLNGIEHVSASEDYPLIERICWRLYYYWLRFWE